LRTISSRDLIVELTDTRLAQEPVARMSFVPRRVTFWGALAMALAAGIGAAFGTVA
jgi:hypothetical protein